MKTLTTEQKNTLLQTLRLRFEKNTSRHEGLDWEKVKVKLENNPGKLWSLNEMERTDGEPDIVAYNSDNDVFTFFDCSAESPKGRRSLCYDREALESRKEFKPENSVVEMAAEMGVNLLTEADYRYLQQLGKFDLKTSSWIKTPDEIKKLGGAIFCDRRYNTVFVYHNGASSYYAARAFRAALHV